MCVVCCVCVRACVCVCVCAVCVCALCVSVSGCAAEEVVWVIREEKETDFGEGERQTFWWSSAHIHAAVRCVEDITAVCMCVCVCMCVNVCRGMKVTMNDRQQETEERRGQRVRE